MSWRTVRHFSSSALSMSATLLRRRHGIQKESRVFNKQLWVLVVRAMIGVGVDDQLRIRHVLLHDERVHRGYVHVVTAVHDECWLVDRLSDSRGTPFRPTCESPRLGRATPCRSLRDRGLLADDGCASGTPVPPPGPPRTD